ncbi:alpha/beta hydrolase [Flagellatimonas centrodinii]|uniref:alpha/beta fold hydrolase n=1 Tax=Flagellatimonas centrodinii TaxID=2806210 RepID=UPI001FF823EC|nr:alpha/beta hydrolase [Flagellatimonas centrodinii]ULQ46334.1 alpha/beta hydrolase [Flagellatimonas centrodinii]
MTELAAVTTGRFWYDDVQLAYERYGAHDAPAVVLLHGILLDSYLNRGMARKLVQEGFQVVLLDLLGHGKSDRSFDPKDHRADFYADQVLALMDHLQLERAVLGGLSLGCIVSLHAATKAPQRVSGLFLEMPVMEWSAPWAALILSPLIVLSRLAPLLQRPLAERLRRAPRPRNEVLTSILNTASMEPRNMGAILHGVLVGAIVPPERARRQLTMPALIVGHGGDKLHEFRDAHVLHQELRNSTLLEARHILELRTRPDRLWPEIRRFFTAVMAAETGQGARKRRVRRKAQ